MGPPSRVTAGLGARPASRSPGRISAHLSSLVLSPHDGPNKHDPLTMGSALHHRAGLIAFDLIFVDLSGTLLGVERIYRYGPGVNRLANYDLSTLCHAGSSASTWPLLQVVSENYIEPYRTMRRAVARLLTPRRRRSIVRAIIDREEKATSWSSCIRLSGRGGTTLTALAPHFPAFVATMPPIYASVPVAELRGVPASSSCCCGPFRASPEDPREICGEAATANRHARRESAPNAAGTRGNGETRGSDARAEPRGETPRDHLRDGVVSGDRHAILGGGGSPVRGETRG